MGNSLTKIIGFISSVAWFICWSLLLEYTIGSAAIAHSVTPNLEYTLIGFLWLLHVC